MDTTPKTAPEVKLNENDQREEIRRALHDFVMLRVGGDTKIGEIAPLLEKHTDALYRMFESDLAQYREMHAAMRNSGYFAGPAGVADMVKDVCNYRRHFDRIRTALGVLGHGRLASQITEDVERLARDHKAQEQRDFDFIAHNDMREVLEDAGYSPDADGIKALLEELAERKNATVYMEAVLDGIDPKLRQELPVERAVASVGGELLRARDAMKSIHRITSAQLDR